MPVRLSDHICMLETSLLHHETVLRHCQSAYTDHLGTAFARTRVQTDQAILALSIVSIGVLPMQFVVSECRPVQSPRLHFEG
jgi:hypothetical protein